MSNNVEVSVIITTYNSEAFIEKALVSVCEQTYPHFEVIISDDASSDGTIDKVKEILLKYPNVSYQLIESKKNQGVGGSKNEGLSKIKYDWVAFLDSDDYWSLNKLERVADAIENNDTNYVIHNEITFENETGEEFNYKTVDYTKRYNATIHPFLALVRDNFLSPTSATIHKSLLDEVGFFDESLRSAQDYDLWLRMSMVGLKVYPLSESLAYYWVRDGNVTSNVKPRLACLLRIVEKNKQNIKDLSPHPSKELRHWKGRVYSRCGLMFLRRKQYFYGVFYISYGQMFKPRIDWVKRLFKGN